MISDPVVDAVRSLEGMSLQQLRIVWERRYDSAPRFRSPDLLRWCLAWRIQTDAYGGIDTALRRRLRGKGPARPEIEAGARIVREWQGKRHVIEVDGNGYLYAGKRWGSLSAIAREIVGTRINGPKFFGLRS